MKKTVLTLFFAIATILVAAQPNKITKNDLSGFSTPISVYQIDTSVYSNGELVSPPTYVGVSSLVAEVDTAVGLYLLSYNTCAIDSNLTIKFKNDSIPRISMYRLEPADVDTLTGVVSKYFYQDFVNMFGSNIHKRE